MKFNFEVTFIDEAKKFYKLYSIWFFAVIVAAPEIYNLAISLGWFSATQVPAGFSRLVQTIAALGGVVRVIKQKTVTLSTLTPEAQAEVALGLETADQAAADQTSAAQATLAAQPPAAPGVLVVSPIPAAVQDAVDAQKTLEAQAAGQPTVEVPTPNVDVNPSVVPATKSSDALSFPAEPVAAPVPAPEPVAAPVAAVVAPAPAVIEAPAPAPVEAPAPTPEPEPVRETVMAVEVPAPAPAPVTPAPVVPKADPIKDALVSDLKAFGLHAESDISEVIEAVRNKVSGEFTKAQLKDPVVKSRFFDRVKTLTEELVNKVETLAKKI